MRGIRNSYDQFRDWRLNVEHMPYEELLALCDKIGYVSTGLQEKDIGVCIEKIKLQVVKGKSCQDDTKCSICQEEFKTNVELGKLSCGHGYHMECITQWVKLKRFCPVCKTEISTACS